MRHSRPHKPLVPLAVAIVGAFGFPTAAAPQSGPVPPGLAALETERSRTCVDVLDRLGALDEQLSPLATRAQRLVAIAEAVALEDERVMEDLDAADPVEAQVLAWFETDQEQAQRYVATLAEELVTERTAGREAIRTVLEDAISAIQAEADETIAAAGDLPQRAGPCDGAIFVRGTVVEACAGRSTPMCEQASLPASEVTGFRFVDDPEAIWDVQELRPWTDPTPIGVGPTGQLDGARTIGYARIGNVVLSVAFSPLLVDRTEVEAEQLAQFQTVNDSLGFRFDHPDLAFAPALGFRATLPAPLGGESTYVLHFGPTESADVVWTGAAGTGAPLEGTVPLRAQHVGMLQAGVPLTLTALRSVDEASEPVFTVEFVTVNQARAVQALTGYMAEQLGQDLAELIRPRGSQ